MQSNDSIKSVATVAALSRCLVSIMLIGMTVSGCSSYAELIPFEQEPIDSRSVQPVEKCTWPEMSEGTINGEAVVYMTESEFPKQVACQTTEQANHAIASDNAEAEDHAIAAFNALITKAEAHQQNAQNELERVDDERKRKTIEVFTYQGILALVLIAISL